MTPGVTFVPGNTAQKFANRPIRHLQPNFFMYIYFVKNICEVLSKVLSKVLSEVRPAALSDGIMDEVAQSGGIGKG